MVDETLDWRTLPAPVPARRTRVDAHQWLGIARAVKQAGGGLLALWGSDERDRGAGYSVCAAYFRAGELWLVELPLAEPNAVFPDLSPLYPAADRLQRAIADLLGVRTSGGDARPWLRHAAWSADAFPLRRDFSAAPTAGTDGYPFVRVEGDGVHEIAVGPVHAGIIEPGHFRFSVVGEKVLRLEARLGYTHKGVEKRFEHLSPLAAPRLASRLCGDSAVAYAWACCMALEAIGGVDVPPRALRLRALLLERERLANHLGDLGALGNDAGFAFGLAQFSRLKEDVLRGNAHTWGARYPFDEIVPGGVVTDPSTDALDALRAHGDTLSRELKRLQRVYDEHAGLQDRFLDTGRLAPELAAQFSVVGLAARASDRDIDLRRDLPAAPYDGLEVKVATASRGDVAARVAVRFAEALESLRLCRELVEHLEGGSVRCELRLRAGAGVGVVEGWRGPVFVYLELADDGGGDLCIRRCHPQDPSWHNWPALEHAILGNIVADFPLINKSFNLAYSGHDL